MSHSGTISIPCVSFSLSSFWILANLLYEGDIFRCTVSLYHVLQPSYYESMIRGLIDIYKWVILFKNDQMLLLPSTTHII